MFQSIEDLIQAAEQHGSIAEAMIQTELTRSPMSRTQLLDQMKHQLDVMQQSAEKGIQGVTSVTKLTGGGGKKLDEYLNSGKNMSNGIVLKAVRNAVAINEVNAAMGLICATPTAGSAGTLAGVLLAAAQEYNWSEEKQINFLFTGGAIGLVIANNASISGAKGGCQAEVGSASAMASAALVEAKGGTPKQAADAMAITIQNLLGLICDPVAGLVEVPCVNRNALGASQAIVSADMVLAGMTSLIPPDQVIGAMDRVGRQMPCIFKETAEGGIADTPCARAITERLAKERISNEDSSINS